MNNIIERNQKLINRYPFLQPRNVFTDKIVENYDYTYIRGIDEIPKGWVELFLQMCEDLRKQLIKDNYLYKFRFTQIKEKYNRMECYHNGCSEKAQKIIDKYTYMARYVCTVCGQPAVCETQGYVASFCEQCSQRWAQNEAKEPIKLNTHYCVVIYENGKKKRMKVSFLREWKKYIKKCNSF